jgi:zinc and cadmium transporter
MPLLAWIVIFSLLGGVLSVMAAASFLLLPEARRTQLLPHLVSFAVGALLGAAFLGLLPHAVEGAAGADPHAITFTVLLGLLGFFLLEKMVLWRHCHTEECEAHNPHEAVEHGRKRSLASLIVVGDGIHNFVDGVLIAAAFLTDVHLGIVTAIAVAAHEIPQEVGDFAILLHSGLSRTRALVYNVLSSVTTVFGGIASYYSLSQMHGVVPYALAVAASSFIYIAVADLIPGLHHRTRFSETVQQMVLIGLGVALIYVAHATLHQ